MNSQERLEHREVQIITLTQVNQAFPEPEFLHLQLSKKVKNKALDIGSLAYCVRGKNESRQDQRGTPVIRSSFVKGRRELIVRLLEYFFGMRDQTVDNLFRRAVYFVDWLNSQGYRELFANETKAQEAYRDYTAHLNHRIYVRKLKPRTASNYQGFAIKIIELLYPESSHYILRGGAGRIISERGSPAPGDAHVQLYTDVFLAIAQQCSSFLLNKAPYPLVVSIRDYEVVLFPSNHGAIGPFKEGVPLYNAAARRIATVEEYMEPDAKLSWKGATKKSAKDAVRVAEINLAAANNDARNWHRINIAGLAMKAYAGIFLLITGASPTEFEQFTYAEALEIEKSPISKELASVKFRAGGKRTLYNIGRKNGLPLLREFLKLREWILDGEHFDKLFFSMRETKTPKEMARFGDYRAADSVAKCYRSISGVFIDPKVPRLSPRQMRKYKSNMLHKSGLSPETVAASLNHTQAMNLSTYAEASPEQQEAELNLLFQAYRHAAALLRERSETASKDAISTAAGHCSGFNQPTLISDLIVSEIEPNCRTQLGCLYCSHYICHSDEEDIHKLLSLQYVINAVRKAAPDTAHAEALYKELSIRIEFIVEALSECSESVKHLVETVRERVFKYGILPPFWERRLSRYEKMGVVF